MILNTWLNNSSHVCFNGQLAFPSTNALITFTHFSSVDSVLEFSVPFTLSYYFHKVDEISDGKYMLILICIFIQPTTMSYCSLFSGWELMMVSIYKIIILTVLMYVIGNCIHYWYLIIVPFVLCNMCTLYTQSNGNTRISFISCQTGVHVSWVLTLSVGAASRPGCSTVSVVMANQLTSNSVKRWDNSLCLVLYFAFSFLVSLVYNFFLWHTDFLNDLIRLLIKIYFPFQYY